MKIGTSVNRALGKFYVHFRFPSLLVLDSETRTRQTDGQMSRIRNAAYRTKNLLIFGQP